MDEFNLTGGSGFIELVLDANQEGPPGGGKNHIVITNMQIFIGAGLGDPEAVGGGINSTGYAGTQFDGAIDINGVANGVQIRAAMIIDNALGVSGGPRRVIQRN